MIWNLKKKTHLISVPHKICFSYFENNNSKFLISISVVVEGTNARANVGDFVLVEPANSPKFFAYVTVQRFTSKIITYKQNYYLRKFYLIFMLLFAVSGYSKTTYLTMEASESVVKLKNGEATNMFIMPIANIRTELKLFNAIFYLDRTPFKNLILDPDSYVEPNIPRRISKFTYSGYVCIQANHNNTRTM